jgi:hypothetical protein
LKREHERRGQIFVELDSHHAAGAAGSGRSSRALVAANAITARTASGIAPPGISEHVSDERARRFMSLIRRSSAFLPQPRTRA